MRALALLAQLVVFARVKIMSFLNRFAFIITSLTSSKRLRPYEDAILSGWRKSLNPEIGLTLDEQLNHLKFVQRQAADTKVVFYYNDLVEDYLFSNLSQDLHEATVTIRILHAKPGEDILKSDIFVHRGKLSSIEFPDGFLENFDILHLEAANFEILSVENYSSLN